jgi:hypothetical protein
MNTYKTRKARNQRRWRKSPAGIKYLKSKAFRDSTRESNRKRDREYRAEIQRRVRAEKLRRGCKRCKYHKHFAALEFHHRNPKLKKFRLSESRNYSWPMVQKEMAKCDVLCANCHAILEFRKLQRKASA